MQAQLAKQDSVQDSVTLLPMVSLHDPDEPTHTPRAAMEMKAIQEAIARVEADALLTKLLGYRVFADDAGKMNRSVTDVAGGLLLVPQFTLAADTKSGTRPSFTPAAAPADGLRLFNYFVEQARQKHKVVETGQFGADMKVSLTNDGPVTFWLQTNAK